jgi:hypothetical protein
MYSDLIGFVLACEVVVIIFSGMILCDSRDARNSRRALRSLTV